MPGGGGILGALMSVIQSFGGSIQQNITLKLSLKVLFRLNSHS